LLLFKIRVILFFLLFKICVIPVFFCYSKFAVYGFFIIQNLLLINFCYSKFVWFRIFIIQNSCDSGFSLFKTRVNSDFVAFQNLLLRTFCYSKTFYNSNFLIQKNQYHFSPCIQIYFLNIHYPIKFANFYTNNFPHPKIPIHLSQSIFLNQKPPNIIIYPFLFQKSRNIIIQSFFSKNSHTTNTSPTQTVHENSCTHTRNALLITEQINDLMINFVRSPHHQIRTSASDD
jgi:hypothetical protein